MALNQTCSLSNDAERSVESAADQSTSPPLSPQVWLLLDCLDRLWRLVFCFSPREGSKKKKKGTQVKTTFLKGPVCEIWHHWMVKKLIVIFFFFFFGYQVIITKCFSSTAGGSTEDSNTGVFKCEL